MYPLPCLREWQSLFTTILGEVCNDPCSCSLRLKWFYERQDPQVSSKDLSCGLSLCYPQFQYCRLSRSMMHYLRRYDILEDLKITHQQKMFLSIPLVKVTVVYKKSVSKKDTIPTMSLVSSCTS